MDPHSTVPTQPVMGASPVDLIDGVRSGYRIALGTFMLAVLSACATPGSPFGAATPEYDRHFGTAVRQVIAEQTLDPEAGERNRGKVTRIDGIAARNAVDRYQDSFKEPPPTFTIFGAPVQNVNGGR